ncbi:hypothetical protein IWX90DRAFT_485134 [Phyllosticta citrichinensis]|uniref:Uncharacterized protein n=1 Tax=Phyllosticta citrichinensis TaxID=1130410 RepID=A0ABR1Y1B7_9PEZI
MSFSKPVRNYAQGGTPLDFAMPPSPPTEMANSYDAVRLNQYLPEIRALQQAQQAKYSQPASYRDGDAQFESQRGSPSEQLRSLQRGPGAFNPYAEQYRKYSAPSEFHGGQHEQSTFGQSGGPRQQPYKYSPPSDQFHGIQNGQGIYTPRQAHRTPTAQAAVNKLPQYLQDASKSLDHGMQAEVEGIAKSLDAFEISPPFNDSASYRTHAESIGSADHPQYAQQYAQRIMHPQTPRREYDSVASGLKARLTQMHADEVVSAPRKYSSPTACNQTPTPQPMTTQGTEHLHRLQNMQTVQHMQSTRRVQDSQHLQDSQRLQNAQHVQDSEQSQHQLSAIAQDFPYPQDLRYGRDNSYARDESYTASVQDGQPTKHNEFNKTSQKPIERRLAFDLGDGMPQAPYTPEPAQSVVPYNSSEGNDTQYGGGHTSSKVWVSDRCRQEEQYEVAQIGVRRNFRKYDKDIMEPIKDFGSWLRHQSAMHNVRLQAEKRKIADMEQRALARENERQDQIAAVMPTWDMKDRQPGHGAVFGLPTIWCPDWKTPDRRVASWPTLSEMKWEGDDRARTGVKRFLPLPREPTNGAVPWNHLPVVHQQPLDQVWKIPTELDILYPMHQIDEEAERDRHRLLPSDLIDAIEPGPRDVYSKGDLDPKPGAFRSQPYTSPEPPALPRPRFVYPHKG